MKRMIGNIILFIVSLTLFCSIYIGLFKISIAAICILLIIFASYVFCLTLGHKSMEELKKFEQKLIHNGLEPKDDSKILLFSLTSLFPTYFCVTVASLIPLFIFEVWLFTIFPCIIFNCLPAISIWKEYYELTHKKLPFWVFYIMFVVAFCLIGVIASSLLLKK